MLNVPSPTCEVVMKTRSLLILLGTLIPGAAMAQQMPMASSAGGVGAVRPIYEMNKSWLTRSAEQMPESNYSFKPTPEVRSFGQIIGHVANAQYMICSAAKGEANPSKADFEKTTAKADLVTALKDSFTYCDAAYQMPDTKAMEDATPIETMKGSRLWALMFNLSHDSEHYGNIVTYLRLKGLVPPSSQQTGM